MSVSPDFLLQSASDIRPKAAPAKSPASSQEASDSKASSFSDVYARERQTRAAERSEARQKSAAGEDDASTEKAEAASDVEGQQPIVAESGKELPSDEILDASGEEPGDPQLALDGLLQSPVATQAAVAAATSPAQASAAALAEASSDAVMDMLNSLPGIKLALDAEGKAQDAQALSPGAVSAERSLNASQSFAGTLAAIAENPAASEEGAESLDPELLEGLDSLGESREPQAEQRGEALTTRLTALSQAIGQQTAVNQRPVLVPGQPVQMQQSGMSEAVVDRVMWLSSQNLKSAEIQLDPAELGRLEVRIELNKDQAAQVTFVSANANVRDQLEGQAHRLRELFAQQGMNQLDVNVSDQSLARGSQGGSEDARRFAGGRSGSASGSSDDEMTLTGVSELRAPSSAAPRGLVDYYA